MKKYKNYLTVIILFIVLVSGVGLWRMNQRYPSWDGKDDFKVALLANDGMHLMSVSRERKMINEVVVAGNVKVWVPDGYGWYLTDRVKKLLESEHKLSLIPDLFFYNFGFAPDVVITSSDLLQGQGELILLKNIGLINYLKYRWYEPGLMNKIEEIKTDLGNTDVVGELMKRDFADSKLLNEEVRITLINSSGANGLAGWLASRMEWQGMTVVGLETRDSLEGACKLTIGKEVKNTETYKSIKKRFECQESIDPGMSDYEVELTLGKDFPKVIKYSY